MNGDLVGAGIVLLFAVGIMAIIVAMVRRSQSLLTRWAAASGYVIVEARPALFYRGPFFWSGRGQFVYRIAVRDGEGHLKAGWARCGDWLLGVAKYKVEVSWDKVPDAKPQT
ncbi:MAG: hypothetical protein MUF84_02140 [Anaerolineae bacterium]|jgi:hypothetical protein|nr:hypothetical protein [Anaerolineae bacterium]